MKAAKPVWVGAWTLAVGEVGRRAAVRYVLVAELKTSAEGVSVGHERKEGLEDDSKVK